MKKYVLLFILTTLFLSMYNHNIIRVKSQGGALLTKKWELEFHGEPTTNLIKFPDSPECAVIGTSHGLVFLDGDGVRWVAHIGSVVIDPLVIGDKIYVVSADRLYKYSKSGDGTYIVISGINAIGDWSGSLVVATISGEKSHIIVFDENMNVILGLDTNFVVSYIVEGDIDGDGDIDIALCSRFGRVEGYDKSGLLLINVSLGLSFGEAIDIPPGIGDVDGDGGDEVIVPITPLRRQGALSRLEIIGYGELNEVNFSVRAQSLSIYDFDGDGSQDIFIGYDAGYLGYSYSTNTTIFNVSTQGIAEGFYGYTHIGDIDNDGEVEFLYISSKGSMVLANKTGIERTYEITNEFIYTFRVGQYKESTETMLVTLRGHIEIIKIAGLNKISEYDLVCGILSGFHPAIYGNGSIAMPLSNGEILIADEDGTISYSGAFNILAQIISGDIDEDGYDEAIFVDYQMGTTKIYAIDMGNISVISNVTGAVYGVSAGDLDRDGTDEIVVNAGTKVMVYGSVSWNTDIGESLVEIPLPIYDVDNDLELEIIAVSTQGSVYILSSDGEIESRFDISIIPDNQLIVGDINMDRGAELLTIYSGGLYCLSMDGSIDFIISKEMLSIHPYPIITDYDADGYLEEVIAIGNNITIYDHNGEELDVVEMEDTVSGFAVLDVGSNWIQDVIVAIPGKIYIKNMITGEDIVNPLASSLIGDYADIYAGDFDGDSYLEIVVVSSGIVYLESDIDVRGAVKCHGVNELETFNTMNYDRDGDLLTEYEEMVIYGTNPYLKDTDNDGFDDRVEIINGWDPTDPSSPRRYPIFWISLILSTVALVVIIYIYREKLK